MYQSLKEKANKVAHAINNKTTAVISATGGAIVASQNASAALPTVVGTTFTNIAADMQAVFDLAFPVVATGLGLMVVIKLFKRFGNKV